jgi:hypothetical protein
MLSRLKLGTNRDALKHAQQCIAEIREMGRQLAITEQEHVGLMLDKLADDLDKSLPNILAGKGALLAAVGVDESSPPALLRDKTQPES